MKSFIGAVPTLIKVPVAKALQPEFVDLVDDARDSLLNELGVLLDSLYLYGSISRSVANIGESDLDLTLVLARPLSSHELEPLERVRSNLEARHPEVTKVDFDLGVYADVLDPTNLDSWGYWLKHECRCIYGTDLALQFQAFHPSSSVAKAVNGDYMQVLHDYASRILQANDEEDARRLQREAAKKLVRATNVLRLESEYFWPESLEEYAKLISDQFPEMAERIDFFVMQVKKPSAPRDVFNKKLMFFVDWMDQLQRIRTST